MAITAAACARSVAVRNMRMRVAGATTETPHLGGKRADRLAGGEAAAAELRREVEDFLAKVAA